MSFQDNYSTGLACEHSQNEEDKQWAVHFYANAIRYTFPEDTETLESREQVRYAVAYLEAWLERDARHWYIARYLSSASRAYVRESLDAWYSKPYILTPDRMVTTANQESTLNFAPPQNWDPHDLLEADLHAYWSAARESAAFNRKSSLREIQAMKAASAQTVQEAVPVLAPGGLLNSFPVVSAEITPVVDALVTPMSNARFFSAPSSSQTRALPEATLLSASTTPAAPDTSSLRP